jgi:Enoyl-CoA hydratase/isomerase
VKVVLHEDMPAPKAGAKDALTSLPFVVVGVVSGTVDSRWLDLCDVTVADDDDALERIEANVAEHPITAVTLALLLREKENSSVGHGLVAESSAYSVLQSGPEFAAWRAAHPAREDKDDGPRVRMDRAEDCLTITLTRPDRLNALDAPMRDALVEALGLAAKDAEIARVELRGEGRAFCAGGDLDEFGTRPDPATAHLVRLERSVGRVLSSLDKPVTTHLHGACMGSGIELAAFTDHVVAAEDTRIALPEIGLGLVPGAGGTVSLPRRIGRLRTAWLAFSGSAIDAATAHRWGLVDELVS